MTPLTESELALREWGDEYAELIHIGGWCPRGGGHFWNYGDDDDAGVCGSKSFNLYLAADAADMDILPEWVRARSAKIAALNEGADK